MPGEEKGTFLETASSISLPALFTRELCLHCSNGIVLQLPLTGQAFPEESSGAGVLHSLSHLGLVP